VLLQTTLSLLKDDTTIKTHRVPLLPWYVLLESPACVPA
jgi:hypothetical protein